MMEELTVVYVTNTFAEWRVTDGTFYSAQTSAGFNDRARLSKLNMSVTSLSFS